MKTPIYPKWYLKRQEEIGKSRAITIGLMVGLSGFILIGVIAIQSALILQKYLRNQKEKQLEEEKALEMEVDKLGERIKVDEEIYGIKLKSSIKIKEKLADDDIKRRLKSHHQLHLRELLLSWCRVLLKSKVSPTLMDINVV